MQIDNTIKGKADQSLLYAHAWCEGHPDGYATVLSYDGSSNNHQCKDDLYYYLAGMELGEIQGRVRNSSDLPAHTDRARAAGQ
jgi:hypothetical protein